MAPNRPAEYVEAFTHELIRTGLMLSDMAADLIEGLPPESYPGEDVGAVVLGMFVGTIRTAICEEDREIVERATELIAVSAERVVEHLKLALELRRRMDDGNDGWASRAWG
jgi:hypothetical protein